MKRGREKGREREGGRGREGGWERAADMGPHLTASVRYRPDALASQPHLDWPSPKHGRRSSWRTSTRAVQLAAVVV
eukprot:scaffold18614_cov24-Tisochrysis_lutea.AAC.1